MIAGPCGCHAAARLASVSRSAPGHRRGRLEQLRLHYHALPIERRIRNPFVAAICETARDELFAT
jgi:hypothetical protein